MDNRNTQMTPAMRKVFTHAEDVRGHVRRDFSTGRGGWPEGVARAMERRGWARLVKRFTWDANWELTDAGVAAWKAESK